MKSLRVFNLRGVSILDQLHFEELLLRSTSDNCVIVNHGIPKRSIVLGFSGKPKELLNLEKVKRLEHRMYSSPITANSSHINDNVEVIRRFTGGGTVIVDKDTLFVSFIMNTEEAGCNAYPREIMEWSADRIYSPLFSRLLAPQSPLEPSSSQEAFRLREHDYVIGNKKIGGNAQTITKGRWVHHTSFLWKFNPDSMQYLTLPAKRPDYRGDRPHGDFLTQLHDAVAPQYRSSVQHFTRALQQQLAETVCEHIAIEGEASHDYLISNEKFQAIHEAAKSRATAASAVAQKKTSDFIPRTFIVDHNDPIMQL